MPWFIREDEEQRERPGDESRALRSSSRRTGEKDGRRFAAAKRRKTTTKNVGNFKQRLPTAAGASQDSSVAIYIEL